MKSRVLRDGNTLWNQTPTKGDETGTEVWLNTQDRYITSTTAYDAYGNATSSTDATGRTTSATYDSTYHAFPVTATNGASETTSTTWDYVCGAPLSTTDPNGQTTTLMYDALCRPTGGSGPLGSFETRSYANLGNANTQYARVETPGPDGNNDWNEAYFDGWGRTYRTMKRGPSNTKSILVDLQFDERGNVAAQTAPYYADETAKVTTFEYDKFNRQVKTTLPDGKTRLNAFPALSGDGFFQSTATNELNQSSTTKFDVFGRVRKSEKSTSLHGNLVTTRNYDILGRMTSLVDPASNTWSYTFDSLGRNLTKNDPDAGTWSYTYDDASRVLTQTDAKSQTTTLTYDSAGRLSTKANPTETVTTTYSQARSGYFNAARPTTVASSLGNGTLQFDYDALGRVVKQTRTLDGTNYTVQKNFDTSGFLRGMQYPDGDTIGLFGGSGTALGYDQAGRLSSIPGILTSVTYNALGAPLVQTNANGTVTTRTYDADRFWLTDIGTVAPSLTLQNLSYTLNDAGMATQVTSPFGAEGWTYGYDELNRLTSSTNAGSSADNQTWAYDSLGRITSNSRIGSYTYGGSRPHAVTAAGSNSYSYDSNGNLTVGGGRSLTWDASNMITQVVTGGNATSFSYGPDGNRIKKTAGSAVAKYPFGDDYEINGSTTTKYFNAEFGVIAKKVGTTLYWLHTDRLGSINATTDGSGAEVLRRSYRSYGELLGQTGTDTESLDYIGQRTDSETGLTYLHARYYDSSLGVFVSPDPIGADLNTYRYVGGDPANGMDTSGLQKDACEGFEGDYACSMKSMNSSSMMDMSMDDFQATMGSYVGMLVAMGFSDDIIGAASAHEQGVDARLVELAQQRMAEEAFAREQATRTDGVQVASLETPVSVDGKLYNMGLESLPQNGTKADGNRALAATAFAFTGGLIVGPSLYGAYSGAQIAAMAAALNQIGQGTSLKQAVDQLNRLGASQSQAVQILSQVTGNVAGRTLTPLTLQNGTTYLAGGKVPPGATGPMIRILQSGQATFGTGQYNIGAGGSVSVTGFK